MEPFTLDAEAEQVALYLSPSEQVALQIIKARRKLRGEERTTTSEIVSDALWNTVTTIEGVSREQITALLASAMPPKKAEEPSKVKIFPRTEKP